MQDPKEKTHGIFRSVRHDLQHAMHITVSFSEYSTVFWVQYIASIDNFSHHMQFVVCD